MLRRLLVMLGLCAAALTVVPAVAQAGPFIQHHVDGSCTGFEVFDTPLVVGTGDQAVSYGVGEHAWPDGVTSLTGTQNNGSEQKSVYKPKDCEGTTTTTEYVEPTTTTTIVDDTTTTTVVDDTTTTTVPGEPTTTTTEAPTTTTVPAEVPVIICRDGVLIEVLPSEVLDTDSLACAETPVFVCADFGTDYDLADAWRVYYLSIGRADLAEGVTGCRPTATTTAKKTLPATGSNAQNTAIIASIPLGLGGLALFGARRRRKG